jgi:phosphoribosylformylglycinamidine (FGAM) synthase-like enzyme
MKVETHNHPTAIAPNPGAATGSGGEIRDEGATGQCSEFAWANIINSTSVGLRFNVVKLSTK